MFDYEYCKELNQTMIIAQIKHGKFTLNILYEDIQSFLIKCIVSTNILNYIKIDVEDDEDDNEDIINIKKIFINKLNEYFETYKIHKDIRQYIISKI